MDGIDSAIQRRVIGPRAGALSPTVGLALLIGLRLWLLLAHSPWRDELQAYLLVRDSVGLPGLFANLRYEGHPGLWYLLLGAAEAVVRSPRALTLAQGLVSVAAAALIWLRAPFAPWLKLLILAGYFPLFEYGVIARSYGLGALLLFAWLAVRRTPWGWLILALMANVAVHFALLSAFCVAAGLWIERRWSWPGAALWAAGGLAAMATIAPPHDLSTGSDLLATPLIGRFIDALRRLSAALTPAAVGRWPYLWQVLPTFPAGQAIGVLVGVLAPLAVRREPRASVLAFGLYAALLAVSTLLYPTYPRHVGVLVLLVIALEWIRVETKGAPASPMVVAWMGAGAVCGLWAAAWALWVPFSPDRDEVRWIAAHHLQTAPWAADPGYVGSAFAAYFDRPTYNVQKQCLNTFIRWDAHAYDDVDDDTFVDQLTDAAPFAYLASDQDLAPLHAPIHLMARIKRGLGDDDVFLYSVDHPKPGPVAACR